MDGERGGNAAHPLRVRNKEAEHEMLIVFKRLTRDKRTVSFVWHGLLTSWKYVVWFEIDTNSTRSYHKSSASLALTARVKWIEIDARTKQKRSIVNEFGRKMRISVSPRTKKADGVGAWFSIKPHDPRRKKVDHSHFRIYFMTYKKSKINYLFD